MYKAPMHIVVFSLFKLMNYVKPNFQLIQPLLMNSLISDVFLKNIFIELYSK